MKTFIKKAVLLIAISAMLLFICYSSGTVITLAIGIDPSTYKAPKEGIKHQYMVNVSHPNCRKLFQIDSSQQQIFPKDDDEIENMYWQLSKILPPTSVDQVMTVPTRLEVTNGQVPYLPCRVQLYDSKQIRQCLLQRGNGHNVHGGAIPPTTWVAFVGDSKMRDKFTAMVFGMGTDVDWIPSWDPNSNGEYEALRMVNLEYEISIKTLRSMRVVSSDNLIQVDFVWAARGLVTNSGGTKKFSVLVEWARNPANIPHLIVIGHGEWTFARSVVLGQSFLSPYDAILKNWLQMEDVLVKLSAHTNILLWPQGRKRDFAAFDYNMDMKFDYKYVMFDYMKSSTSLEWIDMAMRQTQKKTGVIRWDSSMPFNLANIQECGAIREALHRSNNDEEGEAAQNYTPHRREKRLMEANESKQEDDKAKIKLKHNENVGGIMDNNEGSNKEKTIGTNKSLGGKQMRNSDTHIYNSTTIGVKPQQQQQEQQEQQQHIYNNAMHDTYLQSYLSHLYNQRNGNKSSIYKKYFNYILSVLKQMPINDLKSLYNSQILRCNDAMHASIITIQDELYMIFNLLCNQYEPKQDDLCCQI